MPTIEELKALDLKENKRHNKAEEKIGMIGAITRPFKLSPKFNDPSWYLSPDGEISDMFGKVDFTLPLAYNSKFGFSAVTIIRWLPTLGNVDASGNFTDTNAALTNCFKALRQANVSTSAFTKGDYALYHYAKMNIAIGLIELTRALALANDYVHNIQKANPLGILRGLNYDYDEINDNYVVYVNRLNKLIKRFNAFADFQSTGMMRRYELLASCVIKDHKTSKKAQYYAYMADALYKLDVTNSKLKGDDADWAQGSATSSLTGFSNRLIIVDAMIAELENSTTADTINGNIGRVISDDKRYIVPLIKENGEDLTVDIKDHEEILCQIQNTEFIMNGKNFGTMDDIKMNAASTGLMVGTGRTVGTAYSANKPAFEIKYVNPTTHQIVSSSGGNSSFYTPNNTFFSTAAGAANSYVLLTTYEEKPTKENVIVISRNKYTINTTTNVVMSSDSIIAVGMDIVYYPYSALGSYTDYKYPNLLKCNLATMTTVNDVDAYIEIDFFKNLLSQFDWHPLFIFNCQNLVPSTVTGITNTCKANSPRLGFCEIDTATIYERSVVSSFNSSCIQNEFMVDALPRKVNSGI